MVTGTLTARYQTTVPLAVRKSLGLHAGDRIEWLRNPDGSWTLSTFDLTVDDIAGIARTGTAPQAVEQEDAAMIAAATGDFH